MTRRTEHKQKDAISESSLPNSVANREQGIVLGGKKKKKESSKQPQKTFGGIKRDDLKDSDFLDPERRSFPIKTCQDVKDAVSSWGRYTGSMTFEQFKDRLSRKATDLGCSKSLPKAWKDEDVGKGFNILLDHISRSLK